ncbi:carbohydrate binding domain-containing protein [candidate division KSB1 bacterium]|nr:carbohydrate binding domain-containing protein [candidate division KSB1 bacterium]
MIKSNRVVYLIFIILIVFITMVYSQEENLINNPEFDDGTRAWRLEKNEGATAVFAVSQDSLLSGQNSLAVTITNGGTEDWHVQVHQTVQIEIGRFYYVSFMARASAAHTLKALFQEHRDDYTTYWTGPEVKVDETARHYGPFEFNSRVEDNYNKIKFLVGGKDSITVYIDSVVVTSADDPDYYTTVEKFEKRVHTFGETVIPYRLCPPDFYDPNKKYPLVLALHGAGERGDDNEIHIEVHHMATSWADSANQKNYPCFVLAPQCPTDERWVDNDWSEGEYSIANTPISNELLTVNDLIDSLMQEFSIDTNRLYITGLSMGGYGTWDYICRYPDKFAAAIPMSGGGDSTYAAKIAHIPIWVFHGEKDTTVPPSGSRDMIAALERVGRHPVYTHCFDGDCTGMTDEEINSAIKGGASLLYTEWESKGHVIWAESYDLPQLFPWVFSQNLLYPLSVKHESDKHADDFSLSQNYPNPFNPSTVIQYSLEKNARVKIDIFNVLGQQIRTLVDTCQQAGSYKIRFSGGGLESGVYYYRISMDGIEQTRKMMLLK